MKNIFNRYIAIMVAFLCSFLSSVAQTASDVSAAAQQSSLLSRSATKKVTISGYVRDKSSGETLLGANVVELHRRAGTPTNNFGFYSLSLPVGEISLSYSYLGYHSVRLSFENLQRDTVIDVSLLSDLMIQEVVVVSEKKTTGFTSTHPGAIEMPIQQVKKMPAILGEADVIKSIQMMPGITNGVEGLSGMYVRGGSADQNLFCLDGAQVYNIDHLLGLVSVFMPEAVKKVDMYKGSFPARFGGRLSSVVDVLTNDGDLYRYHGMFSVGLLSSQINLQGPIVKGKTAFNFSARRSYYDVLARPFMTGDKYLLYFYDMNLKLNHQFSERSRLFLSLYNGRDHTNTEYKYDWADGYNYQNQTEKEEFRLHWGNDVASLRWNYVFSNKLFSNTTFSYNRYRMDYSYYDRSDTPGVGYDLNVFDYNSGIYDCNLQTDFDYYPNHRNHLRFGGAYVFHGFQPEMARTRETQVSNEVRLDTMSRGDNNREIFAHELALYAEDDITLSPSLVANPGVRLSMFHVCGKSYLSVQPRFSLRYAFAPQWALKTSYSRMCQYVNLLATTSISLPTDLWVPVTDRLKPMISNLYSCGVYWSRSDGWELSMEGYFKQMNHILEYKDGESYSGSSKYWEDIVSSGSGRSYGLECLVQRKVGQATGWVAYTLSRSDRKFDKDVNNGRRFPYKYDHRHILNVVFNYVFSPRIDMGATWKFVSGGVATIANQQTVIAMPDNTIETVPYAPYRGNFRLPASHLLNLSVNFNKPTRHGMRTWNISIYNAYNSMNPAFIYSTIDSESPTYSYNPDTGQYVVSSGSSKIRMKKMTVFPLIPSFSYTYRF